jgi:hypothetical protein
MKMDPDTLTALLSGEHLDGVERADRGLLPLETLEYSEVLRHLALVISGSRFFPREYAPHVPGQPVDERMVVERRGRRYYVCHALRHHPLDPTSLVEESHRRFWSARAAAAHFLRWERHLPGDLDGWQVIG